MWNAVVSRLFKYEYRCCRTRDVRTGGDDHALHRRHRHRPCGRSKEPRPGRGMPRPHQGSGRRGQARLPEGPRGSIARGGRLLRPPARQGAGAVAVRRHPGLDQGPVRHRGRRHHGRLDRAARRRARGERRAERGAAARRGLHPDRPQQHDRVRLLGPGHQPALRHARQRLRPQGAAHSRRLVLGRGGLGDRRHGVRRARHRHRRLLPHPGGAQRHRRLQADRLSRADRRRVPVVAIARTRSGRSPRRCIAARCSTRCWRAKASSTRRRSRSKD